MQGGPTPTVTQYSYNNFGGGAGSNKPKVSYNSVNMCVDAYGEYLVKRLYSHGKWKKLWRQSPRDRLCILVIKQSDCHGNKATPLELNKAMPTEVYELPDDMK